MKRIAWLALAVVLAAAAPVALAQPSGPTPAAEKARFKAGQQLYDSGDFAGALTIFRDALKVGNSPNVRLYVGRCLRELGRLPEAYDEMTTAIEDADARSTTETRYADTRAAGAAERAALLSKVGLIVLAVAERPAGLSVKLAGQEVSEARLGKPIAVTPGAVTVEATAPGRGDFKKEITVRAGASEAVAVTLSAPASSASAPLPPPPTAAPRGGSVRTAGFVVAGLGVAGFAAFGISAAMADDKYKKVFAACGGARCSDASYAGEISAGRTLDTVSTIGLVAGIAGVTAGAAMILFGGPRAAGVSAGASPQGAWITYRGSF